MFVLAALICGVLGSTPVEFVGNVALARFVIGYPDGVRVPFILSSVNRTHLVPEIEGGPNSSMPKYLPVYGNQQQKYVELLFGLASGSYGVLSVPRLSDFCLLVGYYSRDEIMLGSSCSEALTYGRRSEAITQKMMTAFLNEDPLKDAVGVITDSTDGVISGYTYSRKSSTVAGIFVCYFVVGVFACWLVWSRGLMRNVLALDVDAATAFLRRDGCIREAVIIDVSVIFFLAAMVYAQPNSITLYNEAVVDAWGYKATDRSVFAWVFIVNTVSVAFVVFCTLILTVDETVASITDDERWCTWGSSRLASFSTSVRVIFTFFVVSLISCASYFVSAEVTSDGVGPAVFTALVALTTGVVMSSYGRIRGLNLGIRSRMHQSELISLLVVLRFVFETLVLSTAFITLPVVLYGREAKVFRNGIGFAIGVCICAIGGRDSILSTKMLWLIPRRPSFMRAKNAGYNDLYRPLFRIVFTCLIWTLAVASFLFSLMFMIVPAFTDASTFSANRRPGILLASAFATEIFSFGAMWSATKGLSLAGR